MIKFLFSCSASWSVLLVSSVVLDSCGFALLPAVAALVPAVGPLYPAVLALFLAVGPLFYILLIVHRPVLVFVSPLVRAATVRRVLRHATLFVQALLLEPLLSTSCSPVHVLTHVFFSWSAGCVTSVHVLLVVRWLHHQPSLSPTARLRVESSLSLELWFL